MNYWRKIIHNQNWQGKIYPNLSLCWCEYVPAVYDSIKEISCAILERVVVNKCTGGLYICMFIGTVFPGFR